MTKGKGASNDKGKGSFHNSPDPSYLKRGKKGGARNDMMDAGERGLRGEILRCAQDMP